MAFKKGQSGNPAGRAKGVPTRSTQLLKDAILLAAEQAGGPGGLVGYLKQQAHENPGPFLAMLGKVLPLQVTGANDGPLQIIISQTDANL
jgi:hypothetical protein